jgi:Malectin domain
MSAVLDRDQYRAELEAIFASGIFAKAPSLALLLDYVCTKYFEGSASQIKEYNIAVEALGRPPSFDPRQDSIVRVEAFRLRKRLKQYYEQEGANRPLRIVIPPGQYVPHFLEQAPPPADNGQESSQEVAVQTVPAVLPPAREPDRIPRPSPPLWPAPPVRRYRTTAIGGIILLIVLALATAVGVLRWREAKPISNRIPSVPISAESEEIRILAGSSAARYVDRVGNVWSGDCFFHGGSIFTTPNQVILGTPNPEMFRSRREGDFSYDVPLKPGVYELHLYFAETLYGENNTAGGGEASRVFRISINGKPVLFAFDVISDASGSNTADERVFKDISPAADGLLHVQFNGLVNNVPFLNAIEIVPGIRGKMRPVRIVARGRNYTDQRNRVWGADRYFCHGNTVPRSEMVTNTSDPEIYKAERFGNFTYTIPVAEGRYSVTLKFAETWFGPGHPGGGGSGSRLFDVYCNGSALLRNFDIFRAAGGAQRAIERTFHGIVPNGQGKIALSFVPVINYACINAIEVEDEGN